MSRRLLTTDRLGQRRELPRRTSEAMISDPRIGEAEASEASAHTETTREDGSGDVSQILGPYPSLSGEHVSANSDAPTVVRASGGAFAEDVQTFQGWIRYDELPGATEVAFHLFDAYSTVNVNGRIFRIMLFYNAGQLEMRVVISDSSLNIADVRWDWTPTVGADYFVAITIDTGQTGAENQMKFFVGTEASKTVTDQGAPTVVSDGGVADLRDCTTANLPSVRFGQQLSAIAARYYNHHLQDVRRYSVARTAAQMQYDFLSLEDGTGDDIIDAWNFEDNSNEAVGGSGNLSGNTPDYVADPLYGA